MAVDRNFLKSFDQLKRSSEIRSTDKKNKKNFNQTPKLTENFDQLKMSSEIRSTDPLSSELGYLRSVVSNSNFSENY